MQTRLQKYQTFDKWQDAENTPKWKDMFYGKTAYKDAILQSGKIAHFAKAIKIIQKMTKHAKEMFYGKTAWTYILCLKNDTTLKVEKMAISQRL